MGAIEYKRYLDKRVSVGQWLVLYSLASSFVFICVSIWTYQFKEPKSFQLLFDIGVWLGISYSAYPAAKVVKYHRDERDELLARTKNKIFVVEEFTIHSLKSSPATSNAHDL